MTRKHYENFVSETSLILAASLAAFLNACGKEDAVASEATGPAAPESAAPAPEPAVAANEIGKGVYNKI